MADIFNNEKRSEIMRKVKSKKNKSTELRLIDIFKQNGITGWKRNYPVKGHPDFVFLKEKVAVFVDGCFWHGHEGCKYFRLPKSNTPFWEAKITRNIERDKETTQALTALGWKVISIWECELRNKSNREAALNKLFNDITCSTVKRYSVEEPDILVAAESESTYSEG